MFYWLHRDFSVPAILVWLSWYIIYICWRLPAMVEISGVSQFWDGDETWWNLGLSPKPLGHWGPEPGTWATPWSAIVVTWATWPRQWRWKRKWGEGRWWSPRTFPVSENLHWKHMVKLRHDRHLRQSDWVGLWEFSFPQHLVIFSHSIFFVFCNKSLVERFLPPWLPAILCRRSRKGWIAGGPDLPRQGGYQKFGWPKLLSAFSAG